MERKLVTVVKIDDIKRNIIFEDDDELIEAYEYFYGVVYMLTNICNNKIYKRKYV